MRRSENVDRLVRWTGSKPAATFLAQRLEARQITTLPSIFDMYLLGSDATKRGDFDRLIEFCALEYVDNAVRLGGHAYAGANSEPLAALDLPRQLRQAEPDASGVEVWRLEGWRHLLSTASRDSLQEFPDQGAPRVDYECPSFGGDGWMGVYVKPESGNDWLEPTVLAGAVAPVIR